MGGASVVKMGVLCFSNESDSHILVQLNRDRLLGKDVMQIPNWTKHKWPWSTPPGGFFKSVGMFPSGL